MAKKKMKAVPVATEDPRPPEPEALPAHVNPFDAELDLQSLERIRRFLRGRESPVAVYGEDWYELALTDLERAASSWALRHQPSSSRR